MQRRPARTEVTTRESETIRILFPPQFEPFQPYLSGPYLKSLLAKYGLQSSVFDANLDFYEWLVSLAGCSLAWTPRGSSSLDYLRANVDEAVARLREPPPSIAEYRWAVNVVDEYLHGITPRDVSVGLTHLKVGNRYSSDELHAYLERPDQLFHHYLCTARDAVLGSPTITTYLLSLVVIDQLPAAVAFAREIKRRRPSARVIAGGPIVSRLHRQLLAVPWLRDTFDCIVPGEAYRILPDLLDLGAPDAGHVSPDYSDLALNQYWSPFPVFPYLVAHGCKWGRCTFCSHHLTYDGYRASSIGDVLSDLERLTREEHAEYVSFCDEYLAPAQMDALAEGLISKGIKLRWSTFARPEPQYKNLAFLKRLYLSGCRMLMFGLESGSQRVINLMRKGTRVANFRPILESCRDVGIAVRYDFMVGFPGEAEFEVQRTYDFIRDNRDVIDTPFSSYAVGAFELRSGIQLHANPGSDRLDVSAPLRGDLDDQHDFEASDSLDVDARASWRQKLIRYFKAVMDAEILCPQNKTHQLLLKDLHDTGDLRLPPLQVTPTLFSNLVAGFGRGVVSTLTDEGIRLRSDASGGELLLDLELAGTISALKVSTILSSAYEAQNLWSEDLFAEFIAFLYRNDYVILWWVESPLNTKSLEVLTRAGWHEQQPAGKVSESHGLGGIWSK